MKLEGRILALLHCAGVTIAPRVTGYPPENSFIGHLSFPAFVELQNDFFTQGQSS